MRKTLASLLTSFSLVAMALLTSANPALATVPPSSCANQGGLVNVVVCEIDADDNGVLNGDDFKVIIQKTNVLASDELNFLVHALDDREPSLSIQDVILIKDIAVAVYHLIDIDLDPTAIIVLPCGCSH